MGDVPDGDVLVLVLDYGAAVVIHVQVVRRAKDGDHRRELLRRRLAVHGVPRVLRLVPAEYAQQLVALKELACRLVPVVRARGRQKRNPRGRGQSAQYVK